MSLSSLILPRDVYRSLSYALHNLTPLLWSFQKENALQTTHVFVYLCLFLHSTREFFFFRVTLLVNQNSIPEEIKSRLRSGNACYHSVENLLSSRLLPQNLKIKIYRTIILPVVLYGCETWSLTLREERKLRVYENMVLRRIFGPRRDEVMGE